MNLTVEKLDVAGHNWSTKYKFDAKLFFNDVTMCHFLVKFGDFFMIFYPVSNFVKSEEKKPFSPLHVERQKV